MQSTVSVVIYRWSAEGVSADTLIGRNVMGAIIPVSKFDRAFRVVPVVELGVPLRSKRLTADEETQRRDWADNQIMLLIASRSLGRNDCGVIDRKVVSVALLRPYLVEAAKAHGVVLRFRHATLTHKRTLAMRGTGGMITLVSLV